LYGRKIRTKLPEFKGDKEKGRSGTTISMHEIRMQREKSEGLELQIGELWSQK